MRMSIAAAAASLALAAAGAGWAQGDETLGGWFPRLEDLCQDQWLTAEQCAQWKAQREEGVRAACRQAGVTGEAECHKWADARRAEIVADMEARCKEKGLDPAQCRQQWRAAGERSRAAIRQFMADCQTQGGTPDQCREKLADAQRAAQQGGGPGAPQNAPAKKPPAKGSALPPPQ